MDSDWLTARWVPTAKAFYVRALRKAAKMACHKPTRINKSTKHKGTKSSKLSHHSPMNLFASPDDGSKSPCNATADAADDSDDPVSAEVQAWAALPEAEVALHRNSLGLVDEFALMSRLKKKFPLHHVPHCFIPDNLVATSATKGTWNASSQGQRLGLTPRCAPVCCVWSPRQV